MSAIASAVKPKVVYPESDGLPLSDNTRQFRCITTIQGCLDGMFLDDPNVFVAGNLLWYPVEGSNTIVEHVAQREREHREKEQAQQRAERLAAQLRALGVDPEV